MDEPRPRDADQPEQERREPRERITAAREKSDVGPGIEIMLHRQEKNLRCAAASPQLGAIGVLFPSHATQQFPIGGTKRDQVTTAAMIGSKDKPVRRELRKRAFDVVRAKTRTIAADRDHFVVAEQRDSLDRVLETRRKIRARLPMHMWTGLCRITSRREEMDIDRRRNLRPKRGKIEQWPCGDGERTPRQIDPRFVGENEKSTSAHAF